jgi:type VI secretion system protein ImpF
MATPREQAGVTLSLLDRLLDLQPDSSVETPLSQWEQLREFKASVCRDLSALLNTRRAEQDFDPAYEEATNSLLSFGIVDFTSYNLKNGVEQEQVRRSIERAIRQFEPRLARVSVLIQEPDPLRPVLEFQIEALLRVEPAAESVVFDVSLHRESRRVAVSGGRA